MLTVVISYYKKLNNLQLILKALNNQSSNYFEVVLSEDDHNEETIRYLENIKPKLNFPIIHIYQLEDVGFRKNAMLNRAICAANTDKIAFIDGDGIPHRHFVKQYIEEIDKSSLCTGRAVFLDKKTSELLWKTQSLESLNLFRLFFSDTKKLKDGIYFPLFPLSNKV